MIKVGSLKQQILETLKTQSEMRISGSVVEYFSLIEDFEGTEITVEFNGSELFLFEGYESEKHELIVSNIIGIIGIKLWDTDSRVYGSNRPVYATECQKGFNADVLVVKGATELYPREKQVAATLNPRIVIEVLSDSNQGIGFLEKLNCYKKIETLQQILLINQYKPSVSSYIRTSDENEWLNHEYEGITQNIKIEDFTIAAKDIYRNIF